MNELTLTNKHLTRGLGPAGDLNGDISTRWPIENCVAEMMYLMRVTPE